MRITDKIVGRTAIIPHSNPDGDALGAAAAFHNLCAERGIAADIILDEPVPQYLGFMNFEYVMTRDVTCRYDTCVTVDCGDKTRLGERYGIFDAAKLTVNVDHHRTNPNYADINIVDLSAAATSEIVFDLFMKSGVPIDRRTADFLYVGILTDTGCFKYSNTTKKTHLIIAELMDRGADFNRIADHVFNMQSLNSFKLRGLAIERLELFEGGRASIIVLTEDDFKKTGATKDDAEGFSSMAIGVRGVIVSVLIKEIDGSLSISLRSREDGHTNVDVSELARRIGGGGHLRAAGATLYGSVDDAVSMVKGLVSRAVRPDKVN